METMNTERDASRPSGAETTKTEAHRRRDDPKPAIRAERPASSRIRFTDLKAVWETVPFDGPDGSFLLLEPSDEQKRQLAAGDGHTDISNELKKRHSSTALAVNYYLLFQKATGTTVSFEKKVAKPLRGQGKAANLDVVHSEEGQTVFVESKFLEPFYDDYRSIAKRIERFCPYLDGSRYPFSEKAPKVVARFRELAKYVNRGDLAYVEVEQLFKHALAIDRAVREGSLRRDGGIVLRLVRWRPSEGFVSAADSKVPGLGAKVAERENEIVRELELCRRAMSHFIEALGAADFLSFDCSAYDGMLERLGCSETVETLKRMYFFR